MTFVALIASLDGWSMTVPSVSSAWEAAIICGRFGG